VLLRAHLGGERDKNGGAAGGKAALYLNLIHTQGEAAHKPLLLLEIQTDQLAVVFLRDAGSLEYVVVQLALAVRRVHHQERHQKHPLIPAL